jgi:ketosteroid isomerase-like protein
MTTTPAALAAAPTTPIPRRSFLGFAGAGLASGAFLPLARFDHENDTSGGTSRAVTQVVRRLLHAVESRDSVAIWSLFADDGFLYFPFIDFRISDEETFAATVGQSLAALDGLTFTDISFVATADRDAVIAKYRGHATVNFTGKPYEQTYISEAHVRHGKLASYIEYYDTAVINEAFTP